MLIISEHDYQSIKLEFLQLIATNSTNLKNNPLNNFKRNYNETSLLAIYSQLYVDHIKTTHGIHRKKSMTYTKLFLSEYPQQQQQQEKFNIITKISNKFNYSAYQISRLIIENLFKFDSKKAMGRILKNPDLLFHVRLKKKIENEVEFKTVIIDELKYIIANDTNSSPFIDKFKNYIGIKYEYILQRKLEALNVHSYLTEEHLRDLGHSKTPDIKFTVPISIESNGKYFIVNWIDSKAVFGDLHTHKSYKQQFDSYLNRHGPGLVVYWYGFVEELSADSDEVLILNDINLDTKVIQI